MDPSMTSGLNVTVVGVTTVFLALVMLLGVVTVMGRVVGRAGAPSATATAPKSNPAEPAAAALAPAEELEQAAAAAFAMHLARRVSVRGPAPASPWLSAARQDQTQRMR